MRVSDILTTASSNMLRSKVRSMLTIIAVFVGAFTITLTVGISGGISSYIDDQLGNFGAENTLLVQGQTDSGFGSDESGPRVYDPDRTLTVGDGPSQSQVVLSQADVDIIADAPGVIKSEPEIIVQADYIQRANGEKYEVNVNQFIDGTNLVLAAGGTLSNSVSENQIVIPVSYLDSLGYASAEEAVSSVLTLGISDSLGEQSVVTAEVVGVQEETLISSGGASINTPLAVALKNIETNGLSDVAKDRFLTVLAQIEPGQSEEEILSIKEGLNELGYGAQTIEDQIGTFQQVVNAISYVLIFFGAIALLAASFGIINTLYMAVQERTKEIGLMKAMGMGSSKIFTLFSVEAILLGFWGSLLGVLTAMGLGTIVNSVASDTFLEDLQGFNLTSFSVQSVGLIMLLIMGIAFLAGTLPSRRAAKQSPIDALKYE